jgi:hypothetical protein
MNKVWAAMAVLALTPTEAEAERTTIATYYSWNVDFVEYDDGTEPYCSLNTALQRQDGTNGYLGISVLDEGEVWLFATADDWQLTPYKNYGSAILSIDNHRWTVASSASSDGTRLSMTINNPDEFWSAFASGRQFRLTFPEDSINVSSAGSSRAVQTLAACMKSLEPQKKNPFGAEQEKTNPFGN